MIATADSQRYKSIVLLVITAILWSLGGLLIKSIKWNPIAIAGSRSIIAAALMLFIIRKPKLKWSLTQIGGIASYAATVVLFVMANKMTTAANAILLQYTAPIYVALFSAWFLGERTTWIDWVTIFFVIGGMLLFFIDKVSSGGLWGNILAILSGVSFGGVTLFMRKQKDGSPLETVFWGNVVTALISVPFMFDRMPDSISWINLIILGVVQLGISYVLYSIAIKHVTALEAILTTVLEPILNPIWVFIIVGEKPGKWSVIGGAVVLLFITFRGIVTALKQAHPKSNTSAKEAASL